MTAAIVPNTENCGVFGIEERRNHYIHALKWYLENTTYVIVFCENSGTDLSKLFISNGGGRIEFLTYKSMPIYPDRSKGYKEMEILEYAVRNSKYLPQADIIVKCTGRLVLLNINKIVHYLQKRNKKSFISSWMSYSALISDSRFFFCSFDFLKYFIKYKEMIDKYHIFEMNLAWAIRDKDRHTSFIYPNDNPHVHGTGSVGTVYDKQYEPTVKSRLVLLVKRILFDFGFMPHTEANVAW